MLIKDSLANQCLVKNKDSVKHRQIWMDAWLLFHNNNIMMNANF